MPQDIDQTIPSQTQSSNQLEQETAFAQKAAEQMVRWNYLLAQMNGLRQAARHLQVNLVLANMNDELTSDFKKEMKEQMKQIAATMGVENE